MQALEQNDELVLTIIEMRNFARAKQAIDVAKDNSEVPLTGMVDWVFEVQVELMKRRAEV